MDTMTLELTLPLDLFTALGASRGQAEEQVREYSVIGLFQERRISGGKAAELLGLRKRDFVRLLARKGLDYFDYTDDELEEELKVVEQWKDNHAVCRRSGP